MNRLVRSLFLLTFVVGALAHGKTPNPPTRPVLLVTTGRGGDANGAVVLQTSWRTGRPDLLNLSEDAAGRVDMSQYRCVMLVGQGAVDEIAASAPLTSALAGRTVGLYAHVIDDKALDLMRTLRDHGALNLFLTESQLSLLRLRNPSGRAFLQEEARRTWPAPLVIDSVAAQPTQIDDPASSALADADHVIWLGGSYVDSSGHRQILTTTEIVTALRGLHASVQPGSSVAIMLMPRLFEGAIDEAEKVKRLIAMQTILEPADVAFYGSGSLVAEFASAGVPIRTAPPYASLMQLSWSKHTRHYASADQYNLFADFPQRLQPFLLMPTDADQALYALDYVHGGDTGLTEAIRRHACDE